ncbi:MAG: CPBP family intramembrane metalloprotease [Bacteroidetes bacterium]|nr:CPBP family intramembrane metalloprotease [Bacteroidota bacterium]
MGLILLSSATSQLLSTEGLYLSPDEKRLVFPLALALVSFYGYWFIANSKKIKEGFFRRHEHDEASLRHVRFGKISGFFFMGIFPLLAMGLLLPEYLPADLGIGFNPDTQYFTGAWILGLGLVTVPLAYINGRKEKNWQLYPQIRAKNWTERTVFWAAIGWAIYLFGYEVLFRGVLLFPLVHALGLWPAVFINMAVYSLSHLPKGMDETLGALPIGLVLCLLTLASGTIWIAFAVHVVMAWTVCFTALRFNPETNFVGSTKLVMALRRIRKQGH